MKGTHGGVKMSVSRFEEWMDCIESILRDVSKLKSLVRDESLTKRIWGIERKLRLLKELLEE
jgi:hypothetical protein